MRFIQGFRPIALRAAGPLPPLGSKLCTTCSAKGISGGKRLRLPPSALPSEALLCTRTWTWTRWGWEARRAGQHQQPSTRRGSRGRGYRSSAMFMGWCSRERHNPERPRPPPAPSLHPPAATPPPALPRCRAPRNGSGSGCLRARGGGGKEGGREAKRSEGEPRTEQSRGYLLVLVGDVGGEAPCR